MRTLLALALGVAVVTVTVAALAQPPKPKEERTGDDRFEVRITDEMIRHSRIRDALYFVGTAWTLGMLWLLLKTNAAAGLKALSERVTKKPFVVAMLTIGLLIVTLGVLDFPLAYYSGFHVPHQFDLKDQSFGSWMADMLKGLAVNLAIMMPIGALALLAMRRVKRWWLALWLGSIPVIITSAVIQPIVLDPIFNKFEPLKDQVLRQKLLDLASRAGIEGGRVYEVNKSKQTKTLNAYVNGIGPTARIVMWDTLLAEMTHDEVLAVMGHEMGHYVRKDIWKGLGVALFISFFVLILGQRIVDRGIGRRGWESAGDPAALPFVMLVFFVLAFLTTPIGAAYSRWGEHQADKFSLELTHLNEPMATAFRKLAENSKRDPSPHPLMKYWLYSHPPIAERIPFALSYRPWER
ncbi:MAG TPA: M48 family metallopeptidase [Thermoanaerobaculia bacterium]|nr:M48 family metallopeptidase [Thermoanaerobaculia bacterium]